MSRLPRTVLFLSALTALGACAGSAPSGDDGNLDDRVFGNGACLVHADCGPGHACLLGRCVATCDADNPCEDGLVCTDRGICAQSNEPIPAIPALPSGSGVTLTSTQTGIVDGEATTTVQNMTDRDVRIRLESEHPAITAPTSVFTVPAGGTLDLVVQVDPTAYAEGQRTAVVTIVSSEARLDWLVVKPADPTGHWGGTISMPDDSPLGDLALGLNLEFRDDGTIAGQTYADESLFWPRDAAITGTWDAASGQVEIWIRDVLPAEAQGLADGPQNPLGRPVGREIKLTGTLGPDGDELNGTAEETLTGVGDSPIVLAATYAISRDGVLRDPSPTVMDFSDQVPLLAPDDEYPADLDTDACAGLAADYGTAGSIVGSDQATIDACTACASQPFSCSAADAQLCANGLIEAGFNLPTEAVDGNNLQPPAMATWDVCTSDATPVYDPTTKTTCLDRQAIACAGALLRYAVAESGAAPDVVEDALDQALVEGRAAAAVATERLIDAFFAYRDTSGTTKWMVEQGFIDDARAALDDALAVIYAPGYSHLLAAAGPAVVTDARFGVDVAQMLDLQSRAIEALRADLQLQQRVNPADADTSRQRIAYTGAWLHVQGAHVANLVDFYQVPDTYAQLPLVDEALGTLRNLAGQVGSDKNPFGLSPEFVPITLATEGPNGELLTNYEVIRDNANLQVDFYKSKLDAAEAVLETLAQAEYDIVSQTNEIVSSYNERLARLCGQLPGGEPNIEDCGRETGELRELAVRLQIASQRLETAQLALANNEERIRIEENRIQDIVNNAADLEATIDAKQQKIFAIEDEFGDKISALEVAKVQNEVAKVWKDAALDAADQALDTIADAAGADTPWEAAAAAGMGAAKIGIIFGKAGVEADFIKKQFDLDQQIGDLEGEMNREITIVNQEIDMAIRQSAINEQVIDSKATVRNLALDSLMLAREVEQARLELVLAGAQIDTALTEVSALVAGKQRALDILSTDPMNPFTNARFLRVRMELGQSLLRWRDMALAAAYRAGRALEFEINRDVPFIESKLFPARGSDEIDEFLFCLDNAFQDYQDNFSDIGSQALVMELSLRDDVFGLTETVHDYVADEDVPPSVQFANLLASPGVVNGAGNVELRFALPLTGETLFPAAQCDARVESIEVQLVGENLGDNEAGVLVHRDGVSSLRRCDSANLSPEASVVNYHLEPESIGIQATVNGWAEDDTGKSFGYAGWPVSGSQWSVEIPTADEDPRNADFDVRSVGDVVLRITYRAGTVSPNGDGFSPTCG
ncbi:MAG: hypothetical protein D6705_06210 [Deltaproteobacteria bacterium]|nr:MAG: hypothetical protein D6705_06210 [Deltaproteobacteria bacterium]